MGTRTDPSLAKSCSTLFMHDVEYVTFFQSFFFFKNHAIVTKNNARNNLLAYALARVQGGDDGVAETLCLDDEITHTENDITMISREANQETHKKITVFRHFDDLEDGISLSYPSTVS